MEVLGHRLKSLMLRRPPQTFVNAMDMYRWKTVSSNSKGYNSERSANSNVATHVICACATRLHIISFFLGRRRQEVFSTSFFPFLARITNQKNYGTHQRQSPAAHFC